MYKMQLEMAAQLIKIPVIVVHLYILVQCICLTYW